eukprot:GHVO01034709.1.p1 GENE.GHVO01034709.1~~GHVO01034709.1.p1  ORF type:complete len:199 (-),score=19.30 GHVO01034709.1:202-798(-)
MSSYVNVPVGEMDTTALSAAGTLDEPVKETIIRDLKNISFKVLYVMNPKSRGDGCVGLRQWDLWGPLLLCLSLSILLWTQAHSDEKKLVFSLVFIVTWIGAALVTANGALLGGSVSFFQGICVLGYCLAPTVIGAFVCAFIPSKFEWMKVIVLAPTLYLSCGASGDFMANVVPNDRTALAVYPVRLFYVTVSSMILLL